MGNGSARNSAETVRRPSLPEPVDLQAEASLDLGAAVL